MADLLVDEQAPAATPAGGTNLLFPHSSNKQWASKDSTGFVRTLHGIKNTNTADVVANAVDTYLTGSNLAMPSHGMQATTIFRFVFAVTKTAAGVATPIWRVRIGTAGSTADAAILTFTGPAQTGVADTAYIVVDVNVRSIGAAGVISGVLTLSHNLDATGFANIGTPTLVVTSAGFNTAAANLIVGVSVDPGALGVWTHTLVIAEAFNL
jgi:hypothetical protein